MPTRGSAKRYRDGRAVVRLDRGAAGGFAVPPPTSHGKFASAIESFRVSKLVVSL